MHTHVSKNQDLARTQNGIAGPAIHAPTPDIINPIAIRKPARSLKHPNVKKMQRPFISYPTGLNEYEMAHPRRNNQNAPVDTSTRCISLVRGFVLRFAL